jgi:hypothetical protein
METTERIYPLPATTDDPRFTYGLLSDVARLLARHGSDMPTDGRDLLELQGALFGFLYALPGDVPGQ